MVNVKRPRGRPEGQRYPYSRQVRLSEKQEELLRQLSERWDCQQVDVIRALIMEAGEREGLVGRSGKQMPDPEWEARFRQLLAKAQGSDTGDLTPEELEHEITVAREEVRAAHREAARAGRR